MVADCYGTTRLAVFGRYHAQGKALQGEGQFVQDWDRHVCFFNFDKTLQIWMC
jgi:hypothetical protein